MILCLAIFAEHQLVTDKKKTHDYGIYCASMASHGKNGATGVVATFDLQRPKTFFAPD